MEDPQRPILLRQSHFHARASHILKKVTSIRNKVIRRKSSISEKMMHGPYQRNAQHSTDNSHKPYMSQPVLGLDMQNNQNEVDTDSSSSSRQSRQAPLWDITLASTATNTTDFPGSQNILPRTGSVSSNRNSHTHPILPEGNEPSQDDSSSSIVSQPSPSQGRGAHVPNTPSSASKPFQTNPSSPMTGIPSSLLTGPSRASLNIPINRTGIIQQSPHLVSLPQTPVSRLQWEGNVRLSPSIITRQPMPILNLPTLPPPTPIIQEPAQSTRNQTHLRSIPALPHEGPDDADEDPDHEGDSDEEDADEMETEREDVEDAGSDDGEREEYQSPRSSFISEPPPLPKVDTSRLDLTFLDRPFTMSPVASSSREVEQTPVATGRDSFDYFTIRTPVELGSPRTPRPGDLTTPAVRRVPEIHPSPLIPGSTRPGLYHLASRSMVDMLSFKQMSTPTPAIGDSIATKAAGKTKAHEVNATPVPVGPSPAPAYTQPQTTRTNILPDDKLTTSLRRRRSMPMFNTSSEPPPYPSFAPFAHPMRQDVVVQPRDEEGKEKLPSYSNSVYICGIMPRKQEFSAPGVQAKDRKWRRVLCVLEGTAFRVYKCPPGAAGVSAIGEWWEKKVGVGDVTLTTPPTTSGAKKGEFVRPPKLVADAQSNSGSTTPIMQTSQTEEVVPLDPPSLGRRRSKRNLASSLLHPSHLRSSHSRSRSESGPEPACQPRRPSLNLLPSNNSSTVALPTSTPTPPSSSTRSLFLSGRSSSSNRTSSADISEPDPSDLLRVYTLQHAESGLGNDYVKRKNVIRIRLEGEQFLLQAQDVSSVVDWIESFHAGTNIALDLDERPMPKGPMFPRRRRRRPRRPDTAATQRPSNSAPMSEQ